jgi:sugar O-acyltransferase (sialic acid O-acetyltransferase NeuD family)
MSNDLLIIGAGGHALACIDTIEQENRFKIAGLVGQSSQVGSEYFGYRVIGTDLELLELAKKFPFALVGIGQINSPVDRIRIYKEALRAGFILPPILSKTAYVSPHATIGAGTIVMHGAIINAGVVVGENCIINSRAVVEHGARIFDHCHISTGAILNGETSIGMGSFIGSGATIKEGISVGELSLVGMGIALRHNLESNKRYLGGIYS